MEQEETSLFGPCRILFSAIRILDISNHNGQPVANNGQPVAEAIFIIKILKKKCVPKRSVRRVRLKSFFPSAQRRDSSIVKIFLLSMVEFIKMAVDAKKKFC